MILPTAYKNILLDKITGKVTAILNINDRLAGGSAGFTTYSSVFGNTGSALNAASTGVFNSASWGSPIAGTAALSASITPNASGTIVWGRYAANFGNLDGTITASGNGGMLIVPSTTIVSATPFTVSATLRCPFNNGGTLRINQAFANAILAMMLNGNITGANGLCAATSTLSIYNGTQPATADTAITSQTLLYSGYTIAASAFASAASGAAALSATLTAGGVAAANGTATWFRWTQSPGGFVMDGSVGTTGADMTVSSTTYSTGSTAPSVTACTLTLP